MGATPGATPAGRRARGVAAYARIFDVPEDRVPAAMASRVGPVFAEEAFQFAGGAAWADPALTGRDRSLAIITALVAQGVYGDRLRAHLEGTKLIPRDQRSH
jgi:4-carboxymuconolactone decarboxylase